MIYNTKSRRKHDKNILFVGLDYGSLLPTINRYTQVCLLTHKLLFWKFQLPCLACLLWLPTFRSFRFQLAGLSAAAAVELFLWQLDGRQLFWSPQSVFSFSAPRSPKEMGRWFVDFLLFFHQKPPESRWAVTMRSRSNSGVKLDNYARIVQQTILRHQVSVFLIQLIKFDTIEAACGGKQRLPLPGLTLCKCFQTCRRKLISQGSGASNTQ